MLNIDWTSYKFAIEYNATVSLVGNNQQQITYYMTITSTMNFCKVIKTFLCLPTDYCTKKFLCLPYWLLCVFLWEDDQMFSTLKTHFTIVWGRTIYTQSALILGVVNDRAQRVWRTQCFFIREVTKTNIALFVEHFHNPTFWWWYR